jgi:hypothetical protein
VCAIGFVAAPSPAKPYFPLLTLLPQLCWLAFVTRRAHGAGLTRWG